MRQQWQGMMAVMGAVMGLTLVAGCRSSVHQLRVERVDQDLTQGNRGYLVGAPPAVGERTPTRDITELEIQLSSRGRKARAAQPSAAAPAISTAEATEAASTATAPEESAAPSEAATHTPAAPVSLQTYTVKRGESLWKIAKKFYGDAYQWRRIYDANRDKLSNPNRVRPGMTLNIPMGGAVSSSRRASRSTASASSETDSK